MEETNETEKNKRITEQQIGHKASSGYANLHNPERRVVADVHGKAYRIGISRKAVPTMLQIIRTFHFSQTAAFLLFRTSGELEMLKRSLRKANLDIFISLTKLQSSGKSVEGGSVTSHADPDLDPTKMR